MAFLDQLFASQPGGIFGALRPGDPEWEAIRRKLAEDQGAAPQLRYNPDAYVSPVDLRGGGSLAIAPGPSRNVRRDQFGRGAEAQSLYDVAPGGIGLSPPLPPVDVASLQPPAAAPPAMLENRPPPLVLDSELTPPNAQLTQGSGLPQVDRRTPQTPPQFRQPAQPQYQPPAQQGDVGGNIMAGIQNLLHAQPFSPAGIGDLITGLTSGQRTDPVGLYQQNQQLVYNALRQRGVPDADARLAALDPNAQKLIVEQLVGQQRPSGEYKLGDVSIPYTLGPGGQANFIMPGGGKGSLSDLIDLSQSITAQGAARKAGAVAQAEAQGKSAAALPSTLQSADQALSVIDAIQNHPGRQGFWSRTGTFGKIPAYPGTPSYDFATLVDQAKSQVFLTAFNTLRGGGQISNVEGEKATAAIGRLDRAQSPQAFDQALNELRGILQAGKANAVRQAGGGDTGSYTSPRPVQGWTQIAPGIRIREKQ